MNEVQSDAIMMAAISRAAILGLCAVLLPWASGWASQAAMPSATQQRMVEWTIESKKIYADPFNDVDVDVLFEKGGESWRVPTFWRGASRWTVRFAPPTPGTYRYRLASTDTANSDLNGHEGEVSVIAYAGSNALLRHGAIRVSATQRYFEQADGTPFFWLGDTWWTDLSDRLPWEGFKELAADRKAKGFTVIQIVAGLIPSNEELAPVDPGFCNEGGCVWDPKFQRVNPGYFDAADRRIAYLIDQGFVPAIVGGWRQVLAQMGPQKMKQHWRYLIARYGAYPVFWIAGGEVVDTDEYPTGWTEIVRFIRSIDPYHHPLTVHEGPPRYDTALRDESLTDFDLFQPGHGSWASVSTEIAQLNKHYARTTVTKPLVIGEIGYEGTFGEHDATFQRAAFWLAMLNGAAGFTYGTIETAEGYSTEKPAQRIKLSFDTWREAMSRPGSTQVGLGANLLRQYEWWQLAPHPEWVVPRGTTLLEPNTQVNGFDIDRLAVLRSPNPPTDDQLPAGEWADRHGDFRLPYAAGEPGALRIVYLPYWGSWDRPKTIPTVLSLESGVRYRAYYWDPASGVKIDLGEIAWPAPGALIYRGRFRRSDAWTNYSVKDGRVLQLVKAVHEQNCVVAMDAKADTDVGFILRFRDAENYIAAVYSPEDNSIYISERINGVDGARLGRTATPGFVRRVRLTAEIRDGVVALSVTDGTHRVSTPIVDVNLTGASQVGVIANAGITSPQFNHFEVRRSPELPKDGLLERRLYDRSGTFRGEFNMPGIPEMDALGFTPWKDYGKQKHILLDEYRPPRLPFPQDWVLVLAAEHSRS